MFFCTMFAPVDISPNAREEIKKILKQKGVPEGYGLRVGVRGAGCGVAFKLGFDQEKEGDLTYEADGIVVFIQKGETMFLVGKTIHFYNEADGRGFYFSDESAGQGD